MKVRMMGFVGTVLGASLAIPSAHPDHGGAPLAAPNAVMVRWDDDGSTSRVPLDALTVLPADKR